MPEIWLQLATQNGTPKVFEREKHISTPPAAFPLSLNGTDAIPHYPLSDAIVTRAIMDGYIYKVSISGAPFICKLAMQNDIASFERELGLFRKFSSLRRAENLLRVPDLAGTIGFEEGFPGMLLTDICAATCMDDINMGSVDVGERRKWAGQIRATVDILHQNYMVWGDVKADNVLIDAQRNCWLVDFGGGCTEGWVSEELRETKEGGLQGLDNIDRFWDILQKE
ncbi:hypothetical protein P170DRAFT_507948 [Aspergillus steynii IBT 23096]|uniref:Protein kinase domain-containing protein n=1 Tax=Aspergillus steynii IBT 23096 TaxID=1392250 RepID=A0A2I2GK61_9EURO|nr:uncharacterized protein P170DRAFT_507948 [Aspergillus steynii IBT 23096]PLB53265.1 hypothetical protein P170DRAFT_507948 [Aspergillus steynii IBT 23096]